MAAGGLEVLLALLWGEGEGGAETPGSTTSGEGGGSGDRGSGVMEGCIRLLGALGPERRLRELQEDSGDQIFDAVRRALKVRHG